jgi:hypothetical protein
VTKNEKAIVGIGAVVVIAAGVLAYLDYRQRTEVAQTRAALDLGGTLAGTPWGNFFPTYPPNISIRLTGEEKPEGVPDTYLSGRLATPGATARYKPIKV